MSNNKNIKTVIITVIFLFSAFVAVYYFLNKNESVSRENNIVFEFNENEHSDLENSQNKSDLEKMEPTNPGMKVYRNEKYGYSIEYPKAWWYAWFGDSDGTRANVYWFISDKDDMEPSDGSLPLGAKVEVIVTDLEEMREIDSDFPSIKNGWGWMVWQSGKSVGELRESGSEIYEDIEIAGQEAVRVTEKESVFEEGGPTIEVVVVNMEKVYSIKYIGRQPAYSDNLESFEKMLASFALK